MNRILHRLLSLILALGVTGALACSGDSGCGDPYANKSSSGTSTPRVTCGPGTAEQNGECKPLRN